MYKIHHEGFKLLLLLGATLLLLNLAMYFLLDGWTVLKSIITLASSVVFLFSLSFFRIPPFQLQADNKKQILAPAEGKVVVIEEVEEPEYFKDKRRQVSIFMSPANVHVNRSPIPGIVKYLQYHPGDYLVAWHPKSSTENERFTTVIQHAENEAELLIRQIAGKVARKISNYLEEGQQIGHGAELGFIKFGSRVDIFLPLDAKITVNLQDKVKGGKTVIAELM